VSWCDHRDFHHFLALVRVQPSAQFDVMSHVILQGFRISYKNSVFLLPAGPNLGGERNSDESEKLFRKVQLAGVGRGAGSGTPPCQHLVDSFSTLN
jgi:hypothetical protein